MRKFRFLIAMLLMLVMPIQGYAMAAMNLRGPVAVTAEHAGHHAMHGQAAGHHHHADGAAHHAPSSPTHGHNCDKCAVCALCGGILTPSALAFAVAALPSPHLHGLFFEPATVYSDPPLRVPRAFHA